MTISTYLSTRMETGHYLVLHWSSFDNKNVQILCRMFPKSKDIDACESHIPRATSIEKSSSEVALHFTIPCTYFLGTSFHYPVHIFFGDFQRAALVELLRCDGNDAIIVHKPRAVLSSDFVGGFRLSQREFRQKPGPGHDGDDCNQNDSDSHVGVSLCPHVVCSTLHQEKNSRSDVWVYLMLVYQVSTHGRKKKKDKCVEV